jgi:hypothetical protein
LVEFTGKTGMAEYRVHLQNSWGSIVQSVEIRCPDDEAARAMLDQYAGLCPFELWQGARLVERYEADGSLSAGVLEPAG